MIILKNIPFERQARFLLDNVCSVPEDPAFVEALREHGPDVMYGLRAHHDLLRRVYADTDCIEGAGDRERYLSLVATVSFLYACFAFGTLYRQDGQSRLRIDKTTLKQTYKKGSLSRRVRHLAHHGFTIETVSPQGARVSWRKASHLLMSYDRHPDLVPAVKVFAASIASIEGRLNDAVYGKLGMFLKADYAAAIFRKPGLRTALDPRREDILATVDTYRQDWLDLVGALVGRCGLACSGFWHYGGSPSWGISFYEKGKRPLLICTLGSNVVFVEFTLPLDAAERIIRERDRYSETIRERIESFRCVACPKKCRGDNMTRVDGVSLCTGRAEARRIYATLSTAEDLASIHSMLGMVYKS
jgi:hypothetical protein